MHRPRNITGPVARRRREQLGLTQPMLVARLNRLGWDLSRETYAKIEAQIRWLADFELVWLARALDVTPAELLDEAGQPPRRACPVRSGSG
jgi:transcriptional regulator with XRE-family HTH domain